MTLRALAALAATMLLAGACASQGGLGYTPRANQPQAAPSPQQVTVLATQQAPAATQAPTPLSPAAARPAAQAPKQPVAPRCTGALKKIGTFGGRESYATDCLAGPIGRTVNLAKWPVIGSNPYQLKDPKTPQEGFDLLRRGIPLAVVVEAKKKWASGAIETGTIKPGDAIAIQAFGKASSWGPLEAAFTDRASVMWKYVVVPYKGYEYLVGYVPEEGQPDGKKGCNNPTAVVLKS